MPMPFCCSACSACKKNGCDPVNTPAEYEITFPNLVEKAPPECNECLDIAAETFLVPADEANPCQGRLITDHTEVFCPYVIYYSMNPDVGVGSGYLLTIRYLETTPVGYDIGMVFEKHYDEKIDCLNLDDDIPFARYTPFPFSGRCNVTGPAHIKTHVP